jgi:hypothetical protein
LRLSATFLLFALLSASAWARQFNSTCSYSDQARKIHLVKKACVLEEARSGGHFAWIIRFSGGPRITVEEYVSQDGPDHVWKINGQPGRGFEISRRALEGASDDQNLTIAWDE